MASMKSLDRKGTLMATHRQLKVFLARIGVSVGEVPDVIDALFMFFRRVSDAGNHVIDYSVMNSFYHEYSNL